MLPDHYQLCRAPPMLTKSGAVARSPMTAHEGRPGEVDFDPSSFVPLARRRSATLLQPLHLRWEAESDGSKLAIGLFI
jgi:hypothetical protein